MKHSPDKIDYAEISTLKRRVSELETFEEIEAWDSEAKDVIEKINATFDSIPSHKEELSTQLTSSLEEHKKLPFLKRLFKKNHVAHTLKKQIAALDAEYKNLPQLKEEIEAMIDATPDDEEEVKLMIKELKLLKKEFAFEKTSIRNQVRDINQAARAQNASVSNQIILSNAKIRKIQRMSIREQKESALKPREQQIRLLDMQLLEIDKKIHSLEKIKLRSSE